jgi:hypothetical protein
MHVDVDGSWLHRVNRRSCTTWKLGTARRLSDLVEMIVPLALLELASLAPERR